MFSSLLHAAGNFSSFWGLDLVAYVMLCTYTTFYSNQLLSVISSWFTATCWFFRGRKSKATQFRALNLGDNSENPPNVMASDDDDDNNNFVLEILNPFATLTTILQCLGGFKGVETLIHK